MQRYANTGGDSGVSGFEINDSSITASFTGASRPYTYSYSSAGKHHVEAMKQLALAGNGLNAYINHNVKYKYDR